MDVLEELDAVIQEVRNARNVRFSASAMINKQSLLERLDRVRGEASDLLSRDKAAGGQDPLSRHLHGKAQDVIAAAEAERDRLVSQTEVVQAAQRRAQSIIQAAQTKSAELRAQAEDYVDSRLASFEVVLQKTLAVVSKGRDSLKGRLDAGGQKVPQAARSIDLSGETTGDMPVSPE